LEEQGYFLGYNLRVSNLNFWVNNPFEAKVKLNTKRFRNMWKIQLNFSLKDYANKSQMKKSNLA